MTSALSLSSFPANLVLGESAQDPNRFPDLPVKGIIMPSSFLSASAAQPDNEVPVLIPKGWCYFDHRAVIHLSHCKDDSLAVRPEYDAANPSRITALYLRGVLAAGADHTVLGQLEVGLVPQPSKRASEEKIS